jgi:RNA polymerase sigma-70 factor (ECF subfamily)
MPELEQERERIEAAKRDPAQFAGLYESNFNRVYAYVARRVENRATAEDLTSEVFHEALASLGNFEWRNVPFVAWLLRIAARAVADHFKRTGRENVELPRSESDSAGEIERTVAIFDLVDRLPEAQFRVVHMRFVEQKSIREIAEAMGRTEGAVKQLQLRALETLRSQLEAANV